MQPTRDIRRKIRTVRNIEQICRAMKTVASNKLRKAEERVKAARPYADALGAMVHRFAAAEYPHPLLEVCEERRYGVVAISADKGLAGSYNAAVVREALALVSSRPEVRVVPIGRKVSDAFRRRQRAVELSIPLLGPSPDFRAIADLADRIGERYVAGVWDRVDLVYTDFGSRVTVRQLLPITPPAGEVALADILFEPSAAVIADQLLPRYLRTLLFTAVLSAVAAEHAARVAAMSLATENANDLIAQLTIDYNKSRQAAITAELGDIIGAAGAVQ